MAGFLTHYLFGMETCDSLPHNYIHSVITNNTHAFLIGLQGTDLLSFNPHTLSKRGLSYRTACNSLQNQEYAAFFDNMLDYISACSDRERDICIAYMAGFLCYFAIDQATAPYIMFRVWQDLPAKCRSSRMLAQRNEIETVIDTTLLRNRSHMEPSQLNFEALTFINRKDVTTISHLMRHAIQATYKYKISVSEIRNGVRNLRRQNICLQPNSRFKRFVCQTAEQTTALLPTRPKKIYEDYQPDEQDYMNTECKPWYAYPGCLEPSVSSFEDIFDQALLSSRDILENLDSCISWGMDRETLVTNIIHFAPYPIQ